MICKHFTAKKINPHRAANLASVARECFATIIGTEGRMKIETSPEEIVFICNTLSTMVNGYLEFQEEKPLIIFDPIRK